MRRIHDAERKIKNLENSLRSLELLVQHSSELTRTDEQFRLNNMSILYVGGLVGSTNAMKSLVRNLGGNLIHHKGGAGKKELTDLPALIANADAVIVPMDNVSHASALEAKRACKVLQRPFMPVKSSGLGSLAAALTEINSG